MKAYRLNILRTCLSALLVAAAGTVLAAENWTTYGPQPGSKVRIDGTSTIHDWKVEGMIIGGTMELGFDLKNVAPGQVPAKVNVSIPVRSLKSGNKVMDDIMYTHMKMPGVKTIEYRLTELTLKEAPKGDAPLQFESKGELMVAGATNTITMPVTMQAAEGGKLKTVGSIPLKMTQFGMTTPAPKIALGMIKTGDDVKISFEWVTAPVKK